MLQKRKRTGLGGLVALMLLAMSVMAGLPQTAEAGIKNPEITAAQALNATQVKLSWSAPSSNRLDGILIERSTRADSGFAQVLTASNSAASATDSGLTGGQTYYYRLRSYWMHRGSKEYSPYSNVASVTLPQPATASTTTTSISSTTSSTSTAAYPAPVLNSVKVSGSSFVLAWSMPSNPYGTPSGGYDLIIDGVDTGTAWRTTLTSATVTGLDAGVKHTFKVQARWLQADPDQTPESNELSAQIQTATAADYPAPVLNSVKVSGSSFVLAWSIPSNPYGTPSGGYDLIIDGVDTGTAWRTTQTSATVTGLDAGAKHTFKVQARWLQADPDQTPESNELSAQIQTATAGDASSPSVKITSPADSTTVTSEQTLTIVASASDNVGVTKVEFFQGGSLIGTDTTNTYSTTVPVSSSNNGTLSFTAVAYDAAGNTTRSDAVSVTVNIPAATASYPAPVLNSVKVSGSSFVLAWSIPSNPYGTPSGGYDLIIDGVDTGTAWRTTQTSATVTGLAAGAKHTFKVQARWLQADPDQTPESNELSAIIVAESGTTAGSEPDVTPLPVTPPADGILRVFPGAEGFGTKTKAGRGGKIIHVTNLNDSGSGSLRAALEDSNPRTVVFDVGGVIKLNSDLRISSPYVTVAGQTAPGDGIMIRNYGVRITAHDVLIQHIAIRLGDDGRSRDGSWDNADCLQILGGYNIVVDHVSASWGIDENMSVWASNVHDLTFSHCLIAEGLQNSVHTEGRHSKGLLVGGGGNNPKNVAIIKNLFAHNHERNPQLKGGVTAVVANNLTYNSNNEWSWFVTSRDKVTETNKGYYVGNVGKDGPNSLSAMFIKISSSILSGSQIYEDDNVNVSRLSASFKDGAGVMVSSPPITFSPHNLLSADETMYYVLRYAGARPAYRDSVDDRIANPTSGEIVRGNGTIRDHSAGLWPSYASVSLPFNVGSNPNGDDDGDGYTNIEELLHRAAAQVEGR